MIFTHYASALIAIISLVSSTIIRNNTREFGLELKKRAIVDPDCGGNVGRVAAALSGCAYLARTAQASALDPARTAKFEEYFRTTSLATRQLVSARFGVVADECGLLGAGRVIISCLDPGNVSHKFQFLRSMLIQLCSSFVVRQAPFHMNCWVRFISALRYALRAQRYPSKAVETDICLKFFTYESLSGACHDVDQSNSVIHEFSHVTALVSPPTGDSFPSLVVLPKIKPSTREP